MQLKIRYSVSRFIMGRYRGKVLYPFVLFSQAQEEVSDQLFRHELEHVYQIRRNGWFKFYFMYLVWAVKYGYLNIPYEIDARLAENTPLTDEERELSNG